MFMLIGSLITAGDNVLTGSLNIIYTSTVCSANTPQVSGPHTSLGAHLFSFQELLWLDLKNMSPPDCSLALEVCLSQPEEYGSNHYLNN